MRILIVDDYPGAAEASQMLLELLGHECQAVTCGEAALEAAEQVGVPYWRPAAQR